MDLNMTMFYVLTNSFNLYPGAYACPVEMQTFAESRPYLGAYFLVSGVIFISLYLPCFIVMCKTNCRVPVFRIMMVLAVFDMISLAVNSVATGLLDIMGASFCRFPLFIFCSGAIGTGSWMGGCIACILLAIDRCVEINAKFPLGFLLNKKYFPFAMFTMLLYWLYACFFTKPLLFTLEFSSWFFDPKVGFDPSIYHNIAHTINNIVVALATTSLYTYMCYHLLWKIQSSSSIATHRSKRQIVIQAVVLCSFHAVAAYIYVYMQFFYSPPFFVIIGHIAWQWSNGCFCAVYLTLNRTIRNAVIRLVVPRRLREKLGLHVGIDEQLKYSSTVSTVVPAGAKVADHMFFG